MMNRRFKTFAIALMACITALATISSTVAWFVNGSVVSFGNGENVYLNAGTEVEYFEKGTGTKNDPFVISNRTHLYNLAWLQYIGYFDGSSEERPYQPYFELGDDIDMTGITLPPIGTEQFPFIGAFDGKGHEISNLTVSNDQPYNNANSAFGVMKPANNELANSPTPPNIIGFFGVVGELPSQSLTYNSTIVSMKNFTLKNLTVKSETTQTLIGLAAGYVDGSISGVKVGGESKLDLGEDEKTIVSSSITENLSDYGLVGYTTNIGSAGDFSQEISKYYDSEDEETGGGDDWGGSIDMLSAYDRLVEMQKHVVSSNNRPYVYNERFVDGESVDRVSTANASYRRYSLNTGSDYAGNFNMTSVQTNKIYLVGGHYVNRYYYETYDEEGYYITDGDGHYLSYRNNALTNTDLANATIWHFTSTSGSAQIYTNVATNNNLVQTVTAYYLRNNSGTLTTTTTATNITTWTLTKNGTNLSIVNNRYHIIYNNGWTLVTDGKITTTNNPDPISYYRITYNNRYFNRGTTGERPTSIDNVNNEAQFFIDDDNHVYFYRNNAGSGDKYYLVLNTSNNRVRLERNIGSYVYFVYNSTTNTLTANSRYLTLDGSNRWSTTTTNTRVGLTPVGLITSYLSYTLDTVHTQEALRLDSEYDPNPYSSMEFSSEDTTYFPINCYARDTTDTETGQLLGKQYEPTQKNTGYIVAGTTNATYNTNNRSMVFSSYPKDRVLYNGVDSNGNISHVRTINASGIVELDEDDENLKKYRDYEDEEGNTVYGSKTKMQSVLNRSTSVCGLHFTNANADSKYTIRKENVVAATNVRVNGATYSGTNEEDKYQLPVYSVDFNLKQQGYINFFAATYNGGYSEPDDDLEAGTLGNNKINAFFSLHRVIRNSNNKKVISDIKEIKGIYSSTSSTKYVYSYKKYSTGNNYSVVDENGQAFSSSGLTLLFDTDWIGYRQNLQLQDNNEYDSSDPTKATLGAMYYFEIPVDAGEYCLGNVRNSINNNTVEGCYLLYLDIGASGNQDTDRITGYSITSYADPIIFPAGVDFDITGIGNDGGETLCVFIVDESSGVVVFNVNEEDINGNPPTTNTIEIDATSGISQYSYISSSQEDDFIITGENLPEAYDPPDSPTIIRVSHMLVESLSGINYSITITDVLDATGKITSSTYHLVYTYINEDDEEVTVSNNYTLAELQAIVASAQDYYINSIRNQIIVVTLERTSVTSVTFDAVLPDLPWEIKNAYLVTIVLPDGYEITVTVIDSEKYSVAINGDEPIEFDENNETTYTYSAS